MSVSAPPFASMFVKPESVGKPSSIMLVGGEATHKTTNLGLIATVPDFEDKRILMLDFEGGAKVFASEPGIKKAIDEGRFNIVQINKTDPEAYAQLIYFIGERDETGVFRRGAAFQYGYDVLIIDTLDTMQSIAVDWLMKNTFSEEGKLNTLGAWGIVKPWTLDAMWALRSDPNLLSLIAVHSEESVSATGKPQVGVALEGKARLSVGGIPDAVIYLSKESHPQHPKDPEKAQLVATMSGDGFVKGKNRWRLPAKMVDFTLPKFFELIDAQNNTKPAAVQAA